MKTAEEKLKNSIGMQLQFYTHSGETIEATVGRIYELAMDYTKKQALNLSVFDADSLSEEHIEIKFPCELGQSVTMEPNMTYDEVRKANYFRRQGAKWLYKLLVPIKK